MRPLLGLCLLALCLLADAHIFVFHRFDDPRHPSTSISSKQLEAIFDYLRRSRYKVVPLAKVVERLKKSEPIPDDWVVLTIDDSYKSFYRNGLPLFKKYGYPFTLFVYVKATDEGYGDFMSWRQLKEVARYGELGYHSFAHPHMVGMDEAALKADFNEGLRRMRRETGQSPRYFAYPYGEYDKKVRRIAKSFGFEAICNQNLGAVGNGSDPYDLDRIAVSTLAAVKRALRYRHLAVRWLAPREWPKNDTLTNVHFVADGPLKRALLYVTGYGWRRVTLRNGEADLNLSLPLKRRRTRLVLKVGNDKINAKILVKP